MGASAGKRCSRSVVLQMEEKALAKRVLVFNLGTRQGVNITGRILYSK